MKSRARDLVWYVAVGFGIACGYIIGVYIVVKVIPEQHWPSKQWLAFAFFSLVLFAVLARTYWSVRKPKSFWLLFSMLAVAHVAVYASVLKHIEHAFFYALIMPLEAMVIILLIKLTLNVMPSPKTRL